MTEQLGLFIFSGPPGSGKGTIARQCQKKLGWVQLSTGDLFRKHIADRTKLGIEIDFAIKSGKLVDDVLVIEMVAEWIKNNSAKAQNIIFDGFPRTLEQAKLFLNLIKTHFAKASLIVVNFEIANEIVKKRLSARRICPECGAVYSLMPESSKKPLSGTICDDCGVQLIQRSDDQVQVIQKRLDVFHQHADLLLLYYADQNVTIEKIDAQQEPDKLLKEICTMKEEAV